MSCPTMGVSQVALVTTEAGEGSHRWSDDPANGQSFVGQDDHARRTRKIIVKPYAGKPQVRFERRFLETGLRSA